MKFITWNINGYRAVSGQNPKTKYGEKIQKNTLFDFIKQENPDIICLQEIKADLEQIKEELRTPPGYESYYNCATSKKGYSGVAVFSKKKPSKITNGIGIERFDVEGRVIEAKYESFTMFNIYFPKGYAENERLDYKLDFYDSVSEIFAKKIASGESIIVTGDFNTAHKEIDLARPKENINTSGFIPIERQKLDKFVEIGLIDSFREFEKENGHYTWWSQRGRARENNIGWRLDYFFVSADLKNKLTSVKILPGQDGSDHCPVVMQISF